MTTPTPPSSASELYKRLHATSIELILSMNKDISSPILFNPTRVRAVRTPDFIQSWGHNYMVSQKSTYQIPMDLEALVEHMTEAIPVLDSWDATVSEVVVDVERKRTVVRSSHWLQLKGVKEVVEDDIVWLLELDAVGEKVSRAVEFKDESSEERLEKIGGRPRMG